METKEKNLEQDIESWLLNEGGYVKGNMWTYVPFNQGSNGAGNIGDGGNPANHPKDVFARIEALEAQFDAKQQEFKEKYL